MNTFEIGDPPLDDILKDIGRGKIQLPVFQRSWVWNDYHIRSLIASVSQSFPIGAVLTLQASGTEEASDTEVSFKTRLFNGVDAGYNQNEPEILILDGQQRLTALYQSLMSGKAVSTQSTQGKKILRHYYLDMNACLKNEIAREDAVLSCGEDLQLHTVSGKTIELSSPDPLFSNINQEYKNEMFPVSKIFDYDDWQMEYQDFWDFNKDKAKFFNRFRREVIERFKKCRVPVIQIPRETPKEAICLIFEKVNTRGITLTAFELLTASFAVHDFDLSNDWKMRFERLQGKFSVLEELESTNFLRALTLLATKANPHVPISCKRRDILQLTLEDYQTWADRVEDGFLKAARFLHGQKIFNSKDLPYQTQLVPLAAILADLEDLGETKKAQMKIARWYWCGVLGEMYGAATDTRFAGDLSEVTIWVKETQKEKAEEPRTIREANFQENRLPELRTRNGAAYKGVHALVMHDRGKMRCSDFRTEVPIDEKVYFDDNIDIHHIFPKAWCDRRNIKPDDYNSIINKTALSARTNRKIGSKAPSEYLSTIQEEAQINQATMDNILTSHLICPAMLRDDNFWDFFKTRKEALVNAIEEAMGKKVIREGEDPQNTPGQ